jgi:ppGpp synthetase/RelA/SpoT-type nucleotidyltranferase
MSSLHDEYELRRNETLLPLADRLEVHLREIFGSYPRIDRIAVRAKGVDRFVAKAEKEVDGKRKYDAPLTQIQDQIGARIVTFYKTDVEKLAAEVTKYFQYIEQVQIVPESESEFGYEGQHFVLFIPRDIFDDEIKESESILFFELQIKTLFQHAWSEAEHDLGYKPSTALSREQKRQLAFTASQAWGADQIFDELYRQIDLAGTMQNPPTY